MEPKITLAALLLLGLLLLLVCRRGGVWLRMRRRAGRG